MNPIIKNSHTIRVRYADTDRMGIVYNGNYLTYFEVGRTELMRAYALPYIEFEKQGFLLPLIEAHVNYRQAAYYDNLLSIFSTLDRSKIAATLKFEYKVFRDEDLIADGYTLHSFMNSETRKAVRPPAFFIEKLRSIENKNE